MVYYCEKCPMTYTSRKRYLAHKEKKIPCDFVCRDCGEKCLNRDRYYRHMKKSPQCDTYVNPKPKPKKKRASKKEDDGEVLTIAPKRPPKHPKTSDNLVPISDFMKYEAYADLVSKVKAEDCKVTFRKTTTTVVEEIIVEAPDLERMQSLLQTLRPAAMTSLQTLESGKDLDRIVLNVMEQVHASALNPEHHSIVLSDASRHSSRMYTRNPETKECNWNIHPKASAIGVLNQHGPNMVSLLLDDAVEKLCDGTFIRDYTDRHQKGMRITPKDQLPCVYLRTDDEDYVLIIHYDEDAIFYATTPDNATTPLKVEYILFDDLFMCDDKFQDRVAELRHDIYNRKQEVLLKLKTLMISEKVLIKFLHSIQPMKLQGLKNLELCK